MGQRILIVDDDPWILRMVGTMLERRGHTVISASDGEQALRLAISDKPDLVISDVMMPGMDGWSLVRSLRSHAELSLVPVIFLTALNREEDRILGFRLGADDFLPKPFRFEELDLRVDRVLRNVNRIQQQVKQDLQNDEEDNVGFRGDLAHLGVSAILALMEMERKSGILVFRDQQRTGRLFLREGRVIAAFCDSDRSIKGPDAVYYLLTWKSGSFEFSSLDVDMEDQVGASTTHLLMEGARLIDEASTIKPNK